MMLMPCTAVHSEAPISHILKGPIGMGYQALNFRSNSSYVFKMSRMHACLQNLQHIQSRSYVENLPGLGQQCSSTRTIQHAFQIYKTNFSKYMNFK